MLAIDMNKINLHLLFPLKCGHKCLIKDGSLLSCWNIATFRDSDGASQNLLVSLQLKHVLLRERSESQLEK